MTPKSDDQAKIYSGPGTQRLHLKGIDYMRGIADVEALRPECLPGKRLVIVDEWRAKTI